ncbi:hypothetical protein GCM10023318_43650 [Nocardia callitridis]|uniref:Uncharacterized protein n=1 Tax=Nocardia callitridis TaxID=648753 RepID=A0ABP9KL91_9NOCA
MSFQTGSLGPAAFKWMGSERLPQIFSAGVMDVIEGPSEYRADVLSVDERVFGGCAASVLGGRGPGRAVPIRFNDG